MVDLPLVPQPQLFRRGGVSEAPKSTVSTSEIAAPFRQLALALDEGGKAFGTVAESLAKQAGQRAVSTDDKGNVQVEQAPIIGPASNAYERAVKIGALAEGVGQAKRGILDIRKQYAGDPDGYLNAVTSYKDKQTEQFTNAAGPEVGNVIGRVIESTATLSYRSLLNDKRKTDVGNASKNIVSQADSYADDIVTLSEHGASNSPEFKEFVDNYKALLKDGADNPLIAFSQADAEKHVDQTMQRARQAGLLGRVRQVYEDGGREAALGYADGALASWPEQERGPLSSRANEAVQALDAKAEQETVARLKAPLIARDLRVNEGVARIVDGSISQGWLDKHSDQLGPGTTERFQAVFNAQGAAETPPPIGDALIHTAINDPSNAADTAMDAFASGQASKADFIASLRLADQVAQDAQARPWANDIRKDVLARRPSALADVNELLATPDLPRTQAREAADAVVLQHATAERQQLAATIPVPKFAMGSRDAMKPADIDAAQLRTVQAAKAGTLTFGDLVTQGRLLEQWRDITSKEA